MNNGNSFVIGFLFGLVVMGLTCASLVVPLDQKIAKQNELIASCEKNLPRNIRCILQAVEENKE